MYYYDKDSKEYYVRGNTKKATHCKEVAAALWRGHGFSEEQSKMLKYLESNDSAIVEMKTARGKSYLIAGILLQKETTAYILCHNIDMVREIYDRILSLTSLTSKEVAMYSSKTKPEFLPTTKTKVLVTTHDSFAAKGTSITMREPGLIIYDECHMNVSYPKGRSFEKSMCTQLIKCDVQYLY